LDTELAHFGARAIDGGEDRARVVQERFARGEHAHTARGALEELSSSRLRMCRLSGGCEMWSFFAARLTCPSSATATK
jgi:hypothetical protein